GGKLDGFRGLPVYAVGEATARATRQAGLSVAAVGEADVERLLGSIEPDLKLLHLCGEDRRTPVEVAQHITPVPVYRAKPVASPELDEAAGDGWAAVEFAAAPSDDALLALAARLCNKPDPE